MQERRKRPLLIFVGIALLCCVLLVTICGRWLSKIMYQNRYNELVQAMLDESVEAEELGNLIKKVWYNAIHEESDVETDKYTKENGKFVTDFNDALANLFYDKEFKQRINNLQINQNAIKAEMKEVLNPPKGFENAFKALENQYISYLKFTNFVIRHEGSLTSFSDEFSELDTECSELFYVSDLYVR